MVSSIAMHETKLAIENEPALHDTLAYNLKKDSFHVESVGDRGTALESTRDDALRGHGTLGRFVKFDETNRIFSRPNDKGQKSTLPACLDNV